MFSFGYRHSAMTARVALVMLMSISVTSGAQSSTNLLASRSDLTMAASQAERAATTGQPAERTQNAITAAAIRQRLRDGDLQIGDRMVVTIISDVVHRDTVAVRADRSIELPGMIVVPIAGVLRSELQDRIAAEVLKYVKAERVEVTPLVRVGVLGAVARPGYFAIPSDIPITDAIMLAGGPTGTADVGRSVIRRRNQEFRSAGETGKAIATGLTLDQFGLIAGDELVVGQQRNLGVGTFIGITGALASVLALAVTLRH
jgi:protein involved in polysaccharide export with SLBB domain